MLAQTALYFRVDMLAQRFLADRDALDFMGLSSDLQKRDRRSFSSSHETWFSSSLPLVERGFDLI
jgi:hypothetical protein